MQVVLLLPQQYRYIACLTLEGVEETVERYPLLIRDGVMDHSDMPEGCYLWTPNYHEVVFWAVMETHGLAVRVPHTAHVYDVTSRHLSGEWYLMIIAPDEVVGLVSPAPQ